MKKSIAILLLIALLSTLLPSVAWATDAPHLGAAPDMDAIIEPVDLANRAGDLFSKPATRGEVEDNIVFPGSRTEKCAYDLGYTAEISLGAYQTGKADQYYCILIYLGKEPSGDIVHLDYAPFGTEPGFSTKIFKWQTAYAPAEGRYTLVSFTAVLEDDMLYPIDGTASMTDIYLLKGGARKWKSFVMDWETREPQDPIRLTYGETAVLAAGRTPLPSYGQGDTSLGGGLVSVEEAGGIFFVTPLRIGSGMLTFRYGDGMAEIPVEICTKPGGHKTGQSTVARKAGLDSPGYTLHQCSRCGALTREYVPSYKEVFEKFDDVHAYDWHYEYVRDAVYKGLFKGLTTKTFGPNQNMNRAMLVTVLWRYEGEPTAPEAGFSDVSANAWYAKAVDWAASLGIVNGVGKNRFNPDGTITREQLITILYRYAQWKALPIDATGSTQGFPDSGDLSSWAQEAMAWALKAKLISGVAKNNVTYLMPQGNATRAQVSAILVRFIDRILAPEPPIQYPDKSTAVESGIMTTGGGDNVHWALYESGLLQIGGVGFTPSFWHFNAPWQEFEAQVTRIEILYGINKIENFFFEEYPNLESVKIADSVTHIGSQAFANCPKLKEVVLSENLMTIGGYCFWGCTSLEYIQLPESLQSIDYFAFQDCTSLKEIQIPNAVMDNMGSGIFMNCTSLERAKLPYGAKLVQERTFLGCTSLKEIILPYAAETIGGGTFANCSSLESLTLPPFLYKMTMGNFTGCTALKDLYFTNLFLKMGPPPSFIDYPNDGLPFGDKDKTVVWGIPDSQVEEYATQYGYTFRDIQEAM